MDWIKQELQKEGIKQRQLLDELYDHYLTDYEELSFEGYTSLQAKQKVTHQIQQLKACQLNNEIFFINHKFKIYTTMVLSILCFITLLFSTNQEPPSDWPVLSKDVRSNYGMRMHPIKKVKKLHTGIDIRAELGADVFAPSAGKVIESSFDKLLGHYVVIKHDDEYTTRYHHLQSRLVQEGDWVKKSDLIGKVGNSGLSTAPHLHYEVIRNGENVDPRPYLKV